MKVLFFWSIFLFLKIYIAPSKALVQEKLRDWDRKLGSWGINCLELTGDNEFYNIKTIQEADIILTTPEVNIDKFMQKNSQFLINDLKIGH